jgi:hypothetical protein
MSKVKEEKVKEEKVTKVEATEVNEQVAIKIVAEDNDEYLLRATAAFIEGNKDGLTRFINAQLQQVGEAVDSSISIDPNSLTITVCRDTKDRGQVISLDEGGNSIITPYTELPYDSFFIVTDGGQLMAMQKLEGTPDKKIAGIKSIDVSAVALKGIQKQFEESQQQKPATEE